MWGFLVLISGGFFYTVGAIVNAKATPNPTVVRYQAQAESMFVLHNLAMRKARSVVPPATVASSYSSTSFSGDYTDATWESRRSGCGYVTYSRVDLLTTERARSVTASLAKYVTAGRSVGYIDPAGGVIARSTAGPTLSTPPTQARGTPYIYECL